MIRLLMDDVDFTDWEVDSSSSDESYIVSIDDEGNLFCSCLDFYYRKSKMDAHISKPESYCKHIRQVLSDDRYSCIEKIKDSKILFKESIEQVA